MKAKLSLVAIALIILAFILSSCSTHTCPTYAKSKSQKGENVYAKATTSFGSRLHYHQ